MKKVEVSEQKLIATLAMTKFLFEKLRKQLKSIAALSLTAISLWSISSLDKLPFTIDL